MHARTIGLLLSLALLSSCGAGHAEPADNDAYEITAADLEPSEEARAFLGSRGAAVWSEDLSESELEGFIDAVYGAGAPNVVFAGIEEFQGTRLSAWLVIELPTSASARASVFRVYDEQLQRLYGAPPTPDTGQAYLDLTLD